MAFAGCHVLRKEQGLEAVDTLAVIADVEVLAFADTTAAPDREYEYRPRSAGDGALLQHLRCPRIFRDADGQGRHDPRRVGALQRTRLRGV